MKYIAITLTTETREEIQKRLTSIVSAGMFTFSEICRKDPIKLGARFKGNGYWKEATVVACEEKNDFGKIFLPGTPEKICLIRIVHPDCPFREGRKDHRFMENDVFYFYGKSVRIRSHEKTIGDKFCLAKMSFVCKPPYNAIALKKWSESDKTRNDMFFAEASVENEFV